MPGFRSVMAVFFCVVVAVCGLSCSKYEPQPPKRVWEPPKIKECEDIFCEVNFDRPLWSLTSPVLYVYKQERRLLVVDNKVLVRDYHIALGPQPRGDKYYRGDGRTPEGEFFVCAKNPMSRYYKSLGLNYPSIRHAEEALRMGTISWEQYQKIVQANENATLPPAGTPLGGDIFIHGGGDQKDWTLGCIALQDADIGELYEAIPVGTPVKILP